MSQADMNPYQSNWGSYAPFAAQAKPDERATFIRRVYTHVALAITFFVLLEVVLFTVVPQATLEAITVRAGGWSWLLFLGGFMVVSWIARSWANSSTSTGMQYAGLALYVVAEAVLFVPLLFVAVYYTKDPNLLPSAGLLTLFIFGGLTAVTFITRKDFSFMGTFLWWGGLAAVGLILVAVLFGLSLGVWFSVAMILLASGYILYDTSNIMLHYRTDQHVAAALALFASVAVLFWYVLRLLMAFSSRD